MCLTICGVAGRQNPENHTTRQAARLARIAKTVPTLHRAYLLKEGLRLVFQLDHEAVEALEAGIGWARRCRIPTLSTTRSGRA